MLSKILLTFLSLACTGHSREWSIINNIYGEWSEVIERDACVVGGGASGVHAAVELKDMNKTVIVVEQNDRLGGNTHTYIDPATGLTVDIGVVIFQPFPVVYEFFNRFDLPLLNMSEVTWNEPGQPANKSQPAAIYSTIPRHVDFRDGSEVEVEEDSEEAMADAFARMTEVLSEYDYILHGYDLPDPVPEDLAMPFGQFVEKYDLQAAFRTFLAVAQGMGDLLHVPTIYAVKYFNTGDILALSQGYLTHAKGNNSEIYTKAGEYISDENILLESTVIASNRRKDKTAKGHGAELLVSTRDEGVKLLSCKQVVLAIPPHLSNLAGWDLTDEERDVFSTFGSANGYWTGLVRGVGLNETVTAWNHAANTPYNIPVLPALYDLAPVGTIPDTWWIKFAANNPTMTDAQVKSYVEREIATLQRAEDSEVTTPEWLVFQSHAPMHLQVKPQDIKDGFFKQLTALQGGLDGTMFYTGATFHTHYSSLLWRFNRETLIPEMKKHW